MEDISEYSWDVVSCVSSVVDSRKSEDTWDFDASLVQFWVVDQVMNVSAALPLCSALSKSLSLFPSMSSSSWEIRRLAASTTKTSSMGVVVVNVSHRNHPCCGVSLQEMAR